MKTVIILSLAIALLGGSCEIWKTEAQTGARVVAAPAPMGEPESTNYVVSVLGQKIAVYSARVLDAPFSQWGGDYGGPYSFANFDMAGEVSVCITSPRSLSAAVVLPSTAAKVTHEDEHTVVLTLQKPAKFSFEPDCAS